MGLVRGLGSGLDQGLALPHTSTLFLAIQRQSSYPCKDVVHPDLKPRKASLHAASPGWAVRVTQVLSQLPPDPFVAAARP